MTSILENLLKLPDRLLCEISDEILSLNPSLVGVCTPVLAVVLVVISGIGQKMFRMLMSKISFPPSQLSSISPIVLIVLEYDEAQEKTWG